MGSKRLIILSELYYPEDISTGYFLTGLAEGLSGMNIEVTVICSKPNLRGKNLKVASREFHNGVKIRRIRTPFENKNNIFKRIWNILIQTWTFNKELKTIIRSGDKVLVVTNPPTLPWIVSMMKQTEKRDLFLLIHDVYPDVLVPTGYLSRNNIIFRFLNKLQISTLKSFGHIVVLGRDMKSLIEKKIGDSDTKIPIIENWGDPVGIKMLPRDGNELRRKHSLNDKFIIQFSGNLGRTHGIDDLILLARSLSTDNRFHFLVFGDGAEREKLEKSVENGSASNITLLPRCSHEDLNIYLNACDIFFMTFKEGMEGISVPSRMYNVMAAGNPILAVTDARSELAMVVREEEIGWVASAGNIEEMTNAIYEAYENPQDLQGMRVRARRAVENKYTKEVIINKFYKLLNNL